MVMLLLLKKTSLSKYVPSETPYDKSKEEEIGPSFSKDSAGNAIIEIPQSFWKGKDYQSLKIHLSKKVLLNLTFGWKEHHEASDTTQHSHR